MAILVHHEYHFSMNNAHLCFPQSPLHKRHCWQVDHLLVHHRSLRYTLHRLGFQAGGHAHATSTHLIQEERTQEGQTNYLHKCPIRKESLRVQRMSRSVFGMTLCCLWTLQRIRFGPTIVHLKPSASARPKASSHAKTCLCLTTRSARRIRAAFPSFRLLSPRIRKASANQIKEIGKMEPVRRHTMMERSRYDRENARRLLSCLASASFQEGAGRRRANVNLCQI